MLVELSLMMLSAAVMIFLLVHKRVEMEKGTKTIIAEVRTKTDPLLRDIHHTTGEVLSGLTLHNVVLFANHVFVVVIRFFMRVSHAIHITLHGVVEKASKKREDLTRSGAASFYLKQIKETKPPATDGSEAGAEGEKM